ncbi:MAG: hypothetical protein WCZ87_02410 [Thiohalobacteraceae bacterium]
MPVEIRHKCLTTEDELRVLLSTANTEIEWLKQQMADKDDIIKHQAKLNESAHSEIGRLRHALECAVASMESGVTSLGTIRLARAALNGDGNG